jgi:hypothetical protein
MYIWDKICEREEREARKRTGRNEDQELCGWRERETGMKADGTMGMG